MKKSAFILLFFVLKSMHILAQDNTILNLDTTAVTAKVNWPAMKQLIISCNNLASLTSMDSVDYIGQVYYSTPYKTGGFKRSAIKRIKSSDTWFYESFLKTGTDSNKVAGIFFALYDELKKTFKDNCGDDFILASSAKNPISASPVTWLAQWTLYTNYKTLPQGLGKLKIALLVTGSKNVFKQGAMEYTFKIYVTNQDVKYDIFNWDKPL